MFETYIYMVPIEQEISISALNGNKEKRKYNNALVEHASL